MKTSPYQIQSDSNLRPHHNGLSHSQPVLNGKVSPGPHHTHYQTQATASALDMQYGYTSASKDLLSSGGTVGFGVGQHHSDVFRTPQVHGTYSNIPPSNFDRPPTYGGGYSAIPAASQSRQGSSYPSHHATLQGGATYSHDYDSGSGYAASIGAPYNGMSTNDAPYNSQQGAPGGPYSSTQHHVTSAVPPSAGSPDNIVNDLTSWQQKHQEQLRRQQMEASQVLMPPTNYFSLITL